MRKLILLFVFIGIKVSAQIVNIPDPLFKYQLIHGTYPSYTSYDDNNDGELQLTEAADIVNLTINNSNISDLTGIRDFVNLESLSCNYKHITSLDLHGMTNLRFVTAQYNYNLLTSVDVSGCTNLGALYISANPVTYLDMSGVMALKVFKANYNALTSVDFSNMPLLQEVDMSYGTITTAIFDNNPLLYTLTCNNNLITELDLSDSPDLTYLRCNRNALTSLIISEDAQDLRYLLASDNLIPELNLSGTVELWEIDVSHNILNSLDISHLRKLNTLRCNYNGLTSLDVSQNGTELRFVECHHNRLTELIAKGSNLWRLECGYNDFKKLDLSWIYNLSYLDCENTPIEYLDITHNEGPYHLVASHLDMKNNPNLAFICADSFTVDEYNSYFGSIGRYDIGVSPDCVFVPHVYPNPAVDFVTIMAPEKIFVVRMYDVLGNLVDTMYGDGNAYQRTIDVSRHSTGIYFLQIESTHFINTVKLIKT